MHELRDPSVDIRRIHHKPLVMDQRRSYRFECSSSVSALADTSVQCLLDAERLSRNRVTLI